MKTLPAIEALMRAHRFQYWSRCARSSLPQSTRPSNHLLGGFLTLAVADETE